MLKLISTDRKLRKHLFLILFCVKTALLTAQLNYYRGNFHAHSGYSDGNMDSLTSLRSTPAQDYQYADASMHTDFLGISDHNHSTAGMSLAKFHLGVAQSTAATNANFLALYGMEWGVTTGTGTGHVLIYGIDSHIGWQTGTYNIFNAQTDYAALYAKINARPASFLTLAHPQSSDFVNIKGTAYDAVADNAISGVSIRSGYAFSTTNDYSDNPATLYETYFDTMLAKGYHLAPSIDHDNHNTTFGRTLPGRTVVLAPNLTKTAILSAIKNMHYYASDDWNEEVTFTVSGQILGNVANIVGNPAISVAVTDPDGEDVLSIEIWGGTPGSGSNPTILNSNSNNPMLLFSHSIAVGQTRYYFAKIKQADGDLVWTAPIWVTKTATLPVELVDFQSVAQKNGTRLDWRTASEASFSGFEVERGLDGVFFEKIGEVAADGRGGYSFLDGNPPHGLHFYRLKMRDLDGSATFSPIVSAFFQNSPLDFIGLSPNPAADLAVLRFFSEKEMDQLDWSLFDEDGRFQKKGVFDPQKGENALEIPLAGLCNGLFYLLVGDGRQVFLEKKIVHH